MTETDHAIKYMENDSVHDPCTFLFNTLLYRIAIMRSFWRNETMQSLQ